MYVILQIMFLCLFSFCMYTRRCDLTVESDILSVFEEIRKKFGRIDVCVNNAGFSTDSPLLSGQTSDWRSMLEVSIAAFASNK